MSDILPKHVRDADEYDRDTEMTALREQRDALDEMLVKVERECAALRQRHAETVEKAFREGFRDGVDEECDYRATGSLGDIDAAWLASEARKGVAREQE